MDWKLILWDWRWVIVIILKEMAISGALMAKKLAKEAVLNSGQEQEDWVVNRIYPLLPVPVRVVISETTFRKIVKYFYDKAKDYLDDGELNNSIASG